MKQITIFLTLAVMSLDTYAQKVITKQQLIWYGYFNTIRFAEKWDLTTDIQERHYFKPLSQHQFVFRTQVNRTLGHNWQGSVGFCTFFQSPNDPLSESDLIVPELRPHLQFVQRQKYKYFTIDHRYRAEARFFHNTNKEATALEDGFDFGNLRFRYQLRMVVPLWEFSENKFIKLQLFDELHVNVGKKITKNVFDQNRIYAGIITDITPDLSFEVGYQKWFQMRSNGTFFDRNIIRLDVRHKIDVRKKKK